MPESYCTYSNLMFRCSVSDDLKKQNECEYFDKRLHDEVGGKCFYLERRGIKHHCDSVDAQFNCLAGITK